MLKVAEEHYAETIATLQVIRSGLVFSNITDEPDRACAWYGPFEVVGEDLALFNAVSDDAEGHIESAPEEPIYMMERALLAGVRALVREATGGDVSRWDGGRG